MSSIGQTIRVRAKTGQARKAARLELARKDDGSGFFVGLGGKSRVYVRQFPARPAARKMPGPFSA
jgi:hypothetical protein